MDNSDLLPAAGHAYGSPAIIKEHGNVRRRVAGVNIKISAGSDGQIQLSQCGKDAIGADLLEATACRDKIELVIEEHPIEKSMGFRVDDVGGCILKELQHIIA